jgi:hypothetical protein
MSQFQDLYNRVLSDAQFRSHLASDPADALQSVGITPTDDLVAAINSIVANVEEIGKDLGADIDLIGTVPFAT